jgi:hypothetical protein
MANDNAFIPLSLKWNILPTEFLAACSDADIVRHFVGYPMTGAPTILNEAAVMCLDAEWWSREPKPRTEIGVSELVLKGVVPDAHAENILISIQSAHARVMQHAHLRNTFHSAEDPENFHFGTTKFVTMEEAKQVLINTFVRPNATGALQPVVLIGHAVENEFEHLQQAFGIDLRSYGTIVKVIDTQQMASEAGIIGPKGPYIGLRDLLAYFNIHIDNLHTAGNDAASTLMAAVLLALKDSIYPPGKGKPPKIVHDRNIQDVVERVMKIGKDTPAPTWGLELFCTRCDRDNHTRAKCVAKVCCSICRDSGVNRLFGSHKTHLTLKCLYQYQQLPAPDYGA